MFATIPKQTQGLLCLPEYGYRPFAYPYLFQFSHNWAVQVDKAKGTLTHIMKMGGAEV
jgi:hypothetical protein